ncbi:MAG TPA: hypothetical protein VFW93_12580 [Aquabacterium sp.]|uniref:hypothetical protein n=1 Tax=Aquabacterium sp. TaxID=1872578 RepID=UPI002E345091|nr:hypothetical protein [Aquabacterium sp.]HEX5357051.1 hypothetical protein [Aquabacterium sp.]
MTALDRTLRVLTAPWQWAAYGLTVLGLLLPLLVQAATPGGKGKVDATPWCISTGNSTISRICGTSTLHYEYAAMLGEPTAHYGLIWRLTSLTVHTGAPEAPSVGEEIKVGHPEFKTIFGGSEKKIELMAHGYVELRTSLNDRTWGIEFDSGAPTTPDKMSWHISDVPNWEKLIFYDTDCYSFDNKKLTFISKDNAQAIWREGGLRLVKFHACRNGAIGMHVGNLDAAEAAISRYCKSHPVKNAWLTCPKTPKEPESGESDFLDGGKGSQSNGLAHKPASPRNWMDEAADTQKINSKLEQLRTDYRRRMEGQCSQIITSINACYQSSPGCSPKSESEINTCVANKCGSEPTKKICGGSWHTESYKVESMDCFIHGGCLNGMRYKSVCSNYVENPKHREWSLCSTNAQQCRVDAACVARCNPTGYKSASDCVDKQMVNAPTVNNARNAYEKEVQQRTAPNKSTNFLD